ncbi:MAG: C-type lectin domain-containing protein, partial [Methylophagaceae bacterium]
HDNGTLSSKKNPVFKQKEYSSTRARWSINSNVVDNIRNSSSPFVAGASANFFAQSSNYLPNLRFKTRQRDFTNSLISCVSNPTISIGNTSSYQSSGATYLWSDNSTTSSIQTSSSGTYWMEFTSSLGCKASDTVSLVITSNNAALTAVDTSFCVGDSVSASVANLNSNNTYLWSNGKTGATNYISTTGTLIVTEIDTFGCSNNITQDYLMIDRPNTVYNSAQTAGLAPTLTGYTYQGVVGGYFIYKDDQYRGWSDANNVAKAAGLELASFHNQAEWDQLQAWANNGNYYHTGLNDLAAEGTWVFTDGTPFDYQPTNWLNGEPNGGTGENCIGITTNNFNDYGENSGGYALVGKLAYKDSDALAECDSVQLINTEPYDSVAWFKTPSTYVASGASIWASTDGYYYNVSYDNDVVCTLNSDTLQVQLNATPTFTFTASNGVDLGSTVSSTTLTLSNAPASSTYLWSDASTNSSLAVTASGTYAYTVTNQGCSITDSITVYDPLYVAKGGDNLTGNGSLSTPYKTIQKAIDVASSGDKIYV